MTITVLDWEAHASRLITRVEFTGVLVLFVTLSIFSTISMWEYVGWRVLPQALGIMIVAVGGESLVSSRGYYHYTRNALNGPFMKNVPLWIPFLWVFVIQTSFLVGLILGILPIVAVVLSGLLTVAFDLLLLEPYLCRRKQLWIWTPVENGYFDFIPDNLPRFTAPPGNYIVWWAFPIILNYGLVVVSILFP